MRRYLATGNFPQRLSKLLDLLHRVVVHRPDAHHAAAVFQSQPLGDRQGVIVAIPDVNILLRPALLPPGAGASPSG